MIQIYAATNGYLDRIVVDKVESFLADLTDSVRGNEPELLQKIAERRLERRDPGRRSRRPSSSSPTTSASTSTRRATRSTRAATTSPAGAARRGVEHERGRAGPGGIGVREGGGGSRRSRILRSSRWPPRSETFETASASVKNIQKITRAMEMVAAARLRRAEQRIEALRPYADAIRRMTRQAAEAAGNVPRPADPRRARERLNTVGLLLIAGDRGLAGAFNSNIVRAGVAAGREHERPGPQRPCTTPRAAGRRRR